MTFDADFLDMTQVKGIPPKIIWLRTGNTTTEAIAKLLMRHSKIIQSFVEYAEYKDNICLEID